MQDIRALLHIPRFLLQIIAIREQPEYPKGAPN
jgi:hypothetical protein